MLKLIELLEPSQRRPVRVHLMIMHILSAQKGRTRRTTQRSVNQKIIEHQALRNEQLLEVRHILKRAKLCIQIIGKNEKNVGAAALGMTVTSTSGSRVGGGAEVGVATGANPGTETEQPAMKASTKRSDNVFQMRFIVLFCHPNFIIGLNLFLSAIQNSNTDSIHSD